jgi:hypothetical protein
MYNDKVLNSAQTWLPGFSAMYHCTQFGMASCTDFACMCPWWVTLQLTRSLNTVFSSLLAIASLIFLRKIIIFLVASGLSLAASSPVSSAPYSPVGVGSVLLLASYYYFTYFGITWQALQDP